MKESDRLVSTQAMLTALGGSCELKEDEMIITGTGTGGKTGTLEGGTVDACGDHRIAMSAAIAQTVCTGPVTVKGADCTDKSYPGFWEDYALLGGCGTN